MTLAVLVPQRDLAVGSIRPGHGVLSIFLQLRAPWLCFVYHTSLGPEQVTGCLHRSSEVGEHFRDGQPHSPPLTGGDPEASSWPGLCPGIGAGPPAVGGLLETGGAPALRRRL